MLAKSDTVLEVGEVCTLLDDLQLGAGSLLEPQVCSFHRWRRGLATPCDPQRRRQPVQGLVDPVVQIATQIGCQRRVGTRLMTRSIVVLNPGCIDFFGSPKDVTFQVLTQGCAAGKEL